MKHDIVTAASWLREFARIKEIGRNLDGSPTVAIEAGHEKRSGRSGSGFARGRCIQLAPPLRRLFTIGGGSHAPRPQQVNRSEQDRGKVALSQELEPGQPISSEPTESTCSDCGSSGQEKPEVTAQPDIRGVGHRINAADMDSRQFERMERALVVALRTLIDRAELCRRMAKLSKAGGQAYSADRWEKSLREAEDGANVLRRTLDHG